MTPADRIRQAVAAEDDDAIRDSLAPLSEDERADVVPIAREVVAATMARGIEAARNLQPTLLLAYGTLTATEIRKLGWRTRHIRAPLSEVLRSRSAERLGPIVDFLLEDVGGPGAWDAVRPLVRDGIVQRPTSPAYTIAMLSATARRPAAELLAADPALIEVEVWRLFEVEGGGEDSLANHEKFFGDTWGDAFRALASQDAAVRERLLDCSLAALARDFSAYRAGWFSRFHESLRPTDDERSRRVDAYLGLLRSRVGPTVSFAVGALGPVERLGRLDAASLLSAIGPVLAEAPAGTAKAGLDLVRRSAAGSPESARDAAVVASAGLRHSSPDVQRATLALIDRLSPDRDAAVASAVADSVAGVAASQRPAAEALVARLGGDGPAVVEPVNRPVASAASGDAASSPAVAAPTSPTDPARAIEPLLTLEALVDVAVSVIETGEPADDIERVLDGVRRHAGRNSEAVARLTAPLARRARTLLARSDSLPFSGFDPRGDVAAVLLAWTTGDVVASAPANRTVDAGPGAFLSARARETAEAVAGGRPAASVALPTHRGGWIEPAVLVERLGAGRPASTLDLVAAVLRLAPQGRPAALQAASRLSGEEGAVVRYALGGEERIGRTTAWWVAATRVRSPGADDEAVDRRHPRLGPEAARAAVLTLKLTRPTGTYEALTLDVEPAPRGQTGVDLPTALMVHVPSAFSWLGRSDPAMFRWIATVQPGYREVWAALGSLLIGRNLDWWSAEWGNRAFLEPLLEPWSALGPHAMALIGIALGAKEAGERGLAADVARVAVSDGRLTATMLAQGLAAAAVVDLDRPRRWAQSLAELAAGSEAHARLAVEACGLVLPGLRDRLAGDLVPLLRLVDELLAQTGGISLDGGARPMLDELSRSSGQAGRLARSIIGRSWPE